MRMEAARGQDYDIRFSDLTKRLHSLQRTARGMTMSGLFRIKLLNAAMAWQDFRLRRFNKKHLED